MRPGVLFIGCFFYTFSVLTQVNLASTARSNSACETMSAAIEDKYFPFLNLSEEDIFAESNKRGYLHIGGSNQHILAFDIPESGLTSNMSTPDVFVHLSEFGYCQKQKHIFSVLPADLKQFLKSNCVVFNKKTETYYCRFSRSKVNIALEPHPCEPNGRAVMFTILME